MPDPDTPLLAAALTRARVHRRRRRLARPAVDWSSRARSRCSARRGTTSTTSTQFLAWADRVDAVSALWNPLALRALEHAQGVPPRPAGAGRAGRPDRRAARRLGRVARRDLRRAGLERGGREARGRERRPRARAGPTSATRARRRTSTTSLAHGDVLVQQFVPAIEQEGEWSVVLVDGRVGHALRKRPRRGDYRVQEEWGGTHGARRAEREPRRARDAGVRGPARARAVRAHRHRVDRRAVARHGGRGRPSPACGSSSRPVPPPLPRRRASHPGADAVAAVRSQPCSRTGAGVVGALIGLVIGVALSVYVALLDMRKRADGAAFARAVPGLARGGAGDLRSGRCADRAGRGCSRRDPEARTFAAGTGDREPEVAAR